MFIFSPVQRKHQVHYHWKVSCEYLFGLLLHSPLYSMLPSLCESFSSRWNFCHFHNHIEWTDFQTLSGKKNQKSLYYSTFTARLWNDWQLFESVVFSFVATSQNWERGIEILLSASRNLTEPKQAMIIRPHINPNWLSNTPIISFQLSAVPAAKNLQNSKWKKLQWQKTL